MKPWIWRLVERRLRRAVPSDRAATVIGDLLEDFERRARQHGRLGAEWWLRGEIRSLELSYRGRAFRPSRPSRLAGLAFDLRLAVRSLRRQPLQALVIIATVGLAVAVNTALFSVFDGLLFRPLPYPAADRVVHVETPREVLLAMSNDERTARAGALVTTGLFDRRAYAYNAVVLEDGAEGVEAWGLRPAEVSPTLFPLLGVRPLRGRLFTDDDTTVTMDRRPAIIGFDLWRQRFQGDPDIVGRVIEVPGAIFGRRFEVIGVLPRDAGFPKGAQLWIAGPPRPGDDFNVAGLADGVTIEQARATFPGTEMTGLRDHIRPDGAFALAVLLGATALLLLVAWVQVAALLSARTAGRARELGVRLAIGASRARLVRQFAVEGVVVTSGALALAWIITPGLTTAIVHLLPVEMTAGQSLRPDLRTLAFSCLLSAVGIMLLTLAPVGIIRRSAPVGLLRAEGYGAVASSAARVRFGLLSAQLAVTTVLLYMAGLSAHSFNAVGDVDLGFTPDRVVGVLLPPTTVIGANNVERRAHIDQQVRRWAETPPALLGIPGVVAAGGGRLPFHASVQSGGVGSSLTVTGRESDNPLVVDYMAMTPGYVAAMELRVVQGSIPGTNQLADGPPRAVVNQTLAAQLAAFGPVLGQRVTINRRELTIAAVVADFVMGRPDRRSRPQVMLLLANPQGGYMVARLAPDASIPGSLAGIRATLERVWPDNPAREVMLVSDLADTAIADYRARAMLLGLIGALSLPLALAGIVGALSHSISQRLREIGIRMALGAEPRDIRRRVLARAFTAVSIGLVAGLAGGVVMGRLMSAYLFGVQPVDAWTTIGSVAVLVVIAWAAAIVPAQRAARVDPATALRHGI